MDPHPDLGPLVDELLPMLERIFRGYGISVRKAETIVEESLRILAAKQLQRQNPLVWLLHDIIERCERSREEESLEDPSP